MNTCYCEVPWLGRTLPRRQLERVHIARPECNHRSSVRQPEWLRRRDRGLLVAKELTY